MVEALFRLIAFLQTLDPLKYAPPNPSLTIASLESLYAEAQAALAAVSGARENWRTKAKDRALDVEKLSGVATQAVALFASLGIDEQRVEQASFFLRKMRGVRSEPALKDNPETPTDESEKNISAAQTSAAQIVAHFRGLADFLAAQAEYQSLIKDAGLVSTDLTGMADAVEAKHELSVTSATALSGERIERNKVLYDDNASVCNRAALVKEYVKGKYGATSPEYKAVNAISFEKP